VRERRGNAVQHALEVDVDHPVPFVDLQALQGRERHDAGVVDENVDPAAGLDGRVHQALYLSAVRDIGLHGERLSSDGRDLLHQRLEALDPARAQHDGGALRGKVPGGRLSHPAAGPRDHDDLSLDVVAHDDLLLPCVVLRSEPRAATAAALSEDEARRKIAADKSDSGSHPDAHGLTMMDVTDGVPEFVAVVEAKGFRAAGRQLGVSGTALSKALRQLEQRLGVTLLLRTTRSVRLTEAGETFYLASRQALDTLRSAAEQVGELADEPRGTIRLNISSGAEGFLRGPALARFLEAYPDVQLDIIVDESGSDIVAAGYDAGIRLGEVIEQDMIAVPASGPQRLVVCGAPAYFARHPPPEHPRNLGEHACINWRAGPDSPPYRWEFTEPGGGDFSVAVPGRVVANDFSLMMRLVTAGLGLTIGMGDGVRPYLDRGEVVAVLEKFCPPFAGYYLYYPQRRQASPALRALIDYLLQLRQTR
jgi:DNA-binding transcriptional LysR family regulator